MSAEREQRIAALQHGRRQRDVREELRLLGAASVHLLPSTESLALSQALRGKLVALRGTASLRRVKFPTADPAVEAFLGPAANLHAEGVWEFYGKEGPVGFFKAAFTPAVLRKWVDAGHDGFALVKPDLSSGRLLDSVLDDEFEGSFVEVETWGNVA